MATSSPTGIPAREVRVSATVTVDHRAYYGRACGDGFAVISPDGMLTVVDHRLRVVRQIDLSGPVGDFSVTPDGDMWAWVVGDRLWLGDPVSPSSLSASLLPGRAACRWLPSGHALWVANGTGSEVRVEIRTPDNRVVRTVVVPDEFGDSALNLCLHPNSDAVVLWIAAGQDGQQSWLIRDDGAALVAEHLPADGCLPALFGRDGTWLLAADDERMVRRSWPQLAQRALNWADIDPRAASDGNDVPGANLVLLPGGFVSWSTGNGRLHVIDVSTMSPVDEIAMAGHPVRTVAEICPTLTEDHDPCSDFDYSVPGTGGTVLSVHKERTLVLSALRDWSPAPDRLDQD